MLQKMVEKNFEIIAPAMMTSLIMSIFWKIMQKRLKYVFSKINHVAARKKIFQIFFSAFESQDTK